MRKDRAQTQAQTATGTYEEPWKSADPHFYGLHDKPKNKPRRPILASIADWFDHLGEGIFSPHSGVLQGRCLSLLSLTVGCLAYGTFIIPTAISQIPIPFWGWAIGAAFSVLAALGVQTIEIWPRRLKYFPNLADRAAYKAGLERFVNPKEHPNASTMLPAFKFWARTADARKLRFSEIASAIAYVFEGSVGLMAVAVVAMAPVAPALKIGALIWAFLTVGGCESGLWLTETAKVGRLNAKREASYRAEQQRLELQAMADMSTSTTTIDL